MNSIWQDVRLGIKSDSSKKYEKSAASHVGAGIAAFSLLLLTLTGAACSSQKEQPSSQGSAGTTASQPAAASTSAASAQEQAKEIFTTRCAACHGEEGRGDGPGGANVDPKPRNFHDPAWQKSVTDDQIEKTILYGGAAVGKSPLMVANPDLQSQPAVVAALRERIRQIGQQK